MRQICEEQIAAWAPNAAAMTNAKKIVKAKSLTGLSRLADDTLYWGSCQGSGKSAYAVSVDFAEEEPVFRCSCPSRQFPCKHCLALLLEIGQGAEFAVSEIPEEIREKRKKREAAAARKAEKAEHPADAAETGARKRARNAAARKKIEKQLEGLALLRQLTEGLVENGLASLSSVSLRHYLELAKQLGDYYLPGPLLYLNRLILAIRDQQETGGDVKQHEAVKLLIRIRALTKKSEAYLKEKLTSDQPLPDDNILYEELGGIWKLDQLKELGLKKADASLVQLAFQVYYDGARREFVDRGYWADVDTGEVSVTLNYRPVKALKYVKEEDSTAFLVRVPELVWYPGEGNRRIRWDRDRRVPLTKEALGKLRSTAWTEIPAAVKAVKNQIKNILAEDAVGVLLAYDSIVRVKEDGGWHYLVRDAAGYGLTLRDLPEEGAHLEMLSQLPEADLFGKQVLFGKLYYEPESRRMCLAPFSILTEDRVIRLLY